VRPNEYGGRVEQSFTYDDLYRLTHASGLWVDPPGFRNQYSYSLTYSDIHNILRKNQQHWVRKGTGNGNGPDVPQHKTSYDWTYTYGSAKPHAATHIGDRTYFYDLNGNHYRWDHDTNGTRRTIVWDEENRMRSLSDNGRTTDFVYDDKGDRVIKTGAQGETVYVNDKWTVRNREIGTKHIFVGTTRVASKLSPGDAHTDPDDHDLLSQMLGRWWEHRSQSGGAHASNTTQNPHYQVPSSMPEGGQPDTSFVYFYHPDHLGNTSYATDGEGELYEHVQYFPSGELWVDQRSNTERLPYLFSSKELDQETGLYAFGARYYDPRVGLWSSADPAQTAYLDGAPAGGVLTPVNLATYTYVAHNPLILYDPDGRSWFSRALDWVQDGLDAASMALDATGVGAAVSWVPDALNTGISAGRGDWTGAGLSAAAALPFIGAAANATRLGRSVAKSADKANDLRKIEKRVDAATDATKATLPYKRPSGATTPAQRASVQGKPCVDCGAVTPKQVADHKTPLVKEHYETGTIDKTRMRSVDTVQPQCPTCSNRQGAEMSRYSRDQRRLLKDD